MSLFFNTITRYYTAKTSVAKTQHSLELNNKTDYIVIDLVPYDFLMNITMLIPSYSLIVHQNTSVAKSQQPGVAFSQQPVLGTSSQRIELKLFESYSFGMKVKITNNR